MTVANATMWVLLVSAVVGCATPPTGAPAAVTNDAEGTFIVHLPRPPDADQSVHHSLPAQCASGCDVVPPAALAELDDEELDRLFAAYTAAEPDVENDTVEQLLFYGDQTRRRLDDASRPPLPEAHEAWLRRETSRATAVVELRVVDERGRTRAWIDAREVELGVKQHLTLHHDELPGLVASGTLLRVSRSGLWTRL